MTPRFSLPLPPNWTSDDEYVRSLLTVVTSSEIFRNLCGGVHILDFLTRQPDLYSTVLPQEWRDWVDLVDVHDFLHLLLRSDLVKIRNDGIYTTQGEGGSVSVPPESLLDYIQTIRQHCLVRSFKPSAETAPHMPRHITVGMKPKKIHEVSNFAAYVDDLATRISAKVGEPVSLVDFGSGQNYLGRTLACPPYQKHVIAIERKHHNVEGARGMDVHAKLAKKEKIMRNKKGYKRKLNLASDNGLPTPPPEDLDFPVSVPEEPPSEVIEDGTMSSGSGSMAYIEHDIQDGHLEYILSQATSTSKRNRTHTSKPKVLTISLHSCGNLSHHAIRSLSINPSVSAVAIIGCCYNLLTERLGPLTYKHPLLRSNHPRLQATSTAYDPHGFPMSRTLEEFPLSNNSGKGVRLNITARMMAVQAPYNWAHDDSEMFFTRHFYRALLQRILLDKGIVQSAKSPVVDGNSLSGKDEVGTPLIIGSLRKSAFTSFHAYVRAALEKLTTASPDPSTPVSDPASVSEIPLPHTQNPLLLHLNLTDEEISHYHETYYPARKNLAVIWSLMAFSAGVVESVIAVDRWLYLKEQECVKEAWVETVFEYGESPRNLCIVGVRKVDSEENEVSGGLAFAGDSKE